MSKKMIIGIAAGVAAASIIGLLYKRGTLQPLMDKIEDLTDAIKKGRKSNNHPDPTNYIPRGEQKNVSKTLS